MFHLDATRIAILVALAIVLGVPFLFEPEETKPEAGAERLVIVTPHNEQIRFEFETAFDRWHRQHHGGKSVDIDWRTPGGTTEIRRQLYAEYAAAARRGSLDRMNYDLLFGGGSYEHGEIAKPQSVTNADGQTVNYTVSAPVTEFTDQELEDWYGVNKIGRNTLYHPQRHWFGAALSAFGIVYNRDALADIGAPEPATWDDLTHPRLFGWVALADPGQSGSICTTFEVILQLQGWYEGWRILQEAAANSRYFANSSSKIPIDVSIGEAAAGMCIDFYGRTQAQSIAASGDADRLGYVDPAGLTDIDPDPISLLTGAPNRDLAVKFIRFVLSDEGQALWQFPVVDARMQAAPGAATTADSAASGAATGSVDATAQMPRGPSRFSLRRMPIRRDMYERYFDHFVDQVNPFDLARPVDKWDSSMRRYIPPMFSAMAIDNHAPLQAAWSAMIAAGDRHPYAEEMRRLFHEIPGIALEPSDLSWLLPAAPRLWSPPQVAVALAAVSAGSTSPGLPAATTSTLQQAVEALQAGNANPPVPDLLAQLGRDPALQTEAALDAIAGALLGGNSVINLDNALARNIVRARWASSDMIRERDRIRWTAHFRANYDRVVDLARSR